jgi:ferrochelatase
MMSYDALLVVSFGGPEGPDDVMPFLENVTRGRNVPRERLAAVAQHYLAFDGVSPINGQNRALIAALERRFAEVGPQLPIYWGNRNWHPLLDDTVRRMAADGIQRALAFVTTAYSSYSSCRQYLEHIEWARAAAGKAAPLVDKIRPFWNHPGFIDTMASRTKHALLEIPAGAASEQVRVVFTAHSIPVTMAAECDYEMQLRDAAVLIAERLQPPRHWDIAFQSRSGPPGQPWLEPDIVDHLAALQRDGVRQVVVVPIGFISDHMEIVYDLDIEAAAAARDLGLGFVRAQTAGCAPEFVETVRDLVLERIEHRVPAALGTLGPRVVPCRPQCCPAPAASRTRSP